MEVVLASNNEGKIKEFNKLFAALDVIVKPQKEFNIEDADENGLSFIENAIIKARHASKKSGLPAIADDSGIVVPFLNGAPGIYSARYSADKNDASNNALLLKNLEGVEGEDRVAFFICVLAFVKTADDPTPIITEGRIYGKILSKEAGSGGFGYDPLFYLERYGKSMAEIDFAEKNRISHRAQALSLMKEQLESILAN